MIPRMVRFVGGPLDGQTIEVHFDHPLDRYHYEPVAGRWASYRCERNGGEWVGTFKGWTR